MNKKTRGIVGLVAVFMAWVFVPCYATPAQQQSAVKSDTPAAALPYRWFFVFGIENSPSGVEKIKALINTAAEHGLNGMVLSSFGLDGISQFSPDQLERLRDVAAACKSKNIELIPTGFSVGYGGSALGHDRNFAAALPTSLTLRANNGRIAPLKQENLLANGDLEEHVNNRFKGYAFHDDPGEVSFADSIASSGKTSIRFEGFGEKPYGHGRIMQNVSVVPRKTYRFSFRLKTQNLEPATALTAMVLAGGQTIAYVNPEAKSTQDWTEFSMTFINKGETNVAVYAGIWEGKSGKFWLDDLHFSEYGDLSDIVRRAGTPLVLKSLDRAMVFTEGKDFAAIPCARNLDSIAIPAGSAIRNGERLDLACYKIPHIDHPWGQQISLCMSNPALYEYWETEAKKLHEVLGFKKFLLSMDEIRNGGGCQLCRNRKMSMAEILGDCITKQRAILKATDPNIEVLVWSDMLDPAHNAHANYYGVVGDFTDSWKYVPRDVVMMCWYHDIRDKSLPFFSEQGFRTFGAAYYDANDLQGCAEWMQSLKKTPNAQGILYTTWEGKYKLLADFGDLTSGQPPRQSGARLSKKPSTPDVPLYKAN